MSHGFSPRRERAWRDTLVARACAARFDAPAWVIAPRDGVRRALERALAARGGAFVRFVDLAELAASLDARLGLSFARTPTEHERAAALEACLDARAVVLSGDRAAGRFRTALALLPVIDLLRAHGWDGRTLPAAPPALAPDAAARVMAHVELLGDALQELEATLLATSSLDTLARLRRAARALRESDLRVRGLVALDGVDRVTPLERDVLRALEARGAEVLVAPWVYGWHDRDVGDDRPARTDGDVLDALACGALRASRDDGRVALTTARDALDEAELVARWIAERCARGHAAASHAVLVSDGDGSLDRMRRALARHGVAAHGAGTLATHETVPWMVFRASVLLGWRGVDVVDLTTVLSAPGSGVWGGDRDRLCAMLRRETPADWSAVRDLLARFATPKPSGATDDVTLAAESDRAAQLARTRARVEELVDLWSQHGPFARHAPAARLGALAALVKHTAARFLNPVKFADALDEGRAQTLWIDAAARVSEAAVGALARWSELGTVVPADAPAAWLSDVAARLGVVTDGASSVRGEGVALLAGDSSLAVAPETVVVTGFSRGRFPTPRAPELLLGPLERAWLATASPDLAHLPDESVHAVCARRDTARALALATDRVLLVAPRRALDGSTLDPALAWHDVASLWPEETPAPHALALDVWMARDLSDGPRTARAHRARSLDALAHGRDDEALSHARAASHDRRARDLFAALDAPDRHFALGDLVGDLVHETVYSPGDLETLLTCRYAFLTGALLGLSPLPLARVPALAAGDRARVAHAALRHLDAMPAPHDESAQRRAVDLALAEVLPWAAAADAHGPLVELRRSVERFLRRYESMRRTLGLGAGANTTPASDEAVTIPLPGTRAQAMKVKTGALRVEVTDAQGQTVLVDLRSGGRRPRAELLDAGLDVGSVLAPMVAEASGASSVAAVLRVSVTRARGEYVPPPKDATREAHRERVLGDIARALDALLEDGAQWAPLDASRAAELERLGASPCRGCAMRLACRLNLPGGAR